MLQSPFFLYVFLFLFGTLFWRYYRLLLWNDYVAVFRWIPFHIFFIAFFWAIEEIPRLCCLARKKSVTYTTLFLGHQRFYHIMSGILRYMFLIAFPGTINSPLDMLLTTVRTSLDGSFFPGNFPLLFFFAFCRTIPFGRMYTPIICIRHFLSAYAAVRWFN